MGNVCGGEQTNTKSTKSLKLREDKKPAQQAKIVLLGNIAVGNIDGILNGINFIERILKMHLGYIC